MADVDPRVTEVLAVTVQAYKIQFDYVVQCIETGRWFFAIPALHDLQRGAHAMMRMLGEMGAAEQTTGSDLSEEAAEEIKAAYRDEMSERLVPLESRMKKVVADVLVRDLGLSFEDFEVKGDHEL